MVRGPRRGPWPPSNLPPHSAQDQENSQDMRLSEPKPRQPRPTGHLLTLLTAPYTPSLPPQPWPAAASHLSPTFFPSLVSASGHPTGPSRLAQTHWALPLPRLSPGWTAIGDLPVSLTSLRKPLKALTSPENRIPAPLWSKNSHNAVFIPSPTNSRAHRDSRAWSSQGREQTQLDKGLRNTT